MRLKTSNGGSDYTGTESEIREILFSISLAKAREWLLKRMLSENLMTRDILSFVKNQAHLRLENKDLDVNTIKISMKAKLVDVRHNKAKLLCHLRRLKDKLLESLGGRMFKMRKTMKKLKEDPLKTWESKMKTYRQKIEHYKRKQRSLDMKKYPLKSKKKKNVHIPQRLAAYDSLHIFKDPKDFPKKNKPLGPFICDAQIKISDDELKILCKQPKFSIMGDIKRTDMLLESEKMLGKHRFQDGPLNKKKQRCLITESLAPELPARPLSGPLENSGEIGDPSDGLLTRGGMLKYPSCGLPTRGGTIKDPSSDYLGENKGSTRKLNLDRTWKENEDRFLYNPFTK